MVQQQKLFTLFYLNEPLELYRILYILFTSLGVLIQIINYIAAHHFQFLLMYCTCTCVMSQAVSMLHGTILSSCAIYRFVNMRQKIHISVCF